MPALHPLPLPSPMIPLTFICHLTTQSVVPGSAASVTPRACWKCRTSDPNPDPWHFAKSVINVSYHYDTGPLLQTPLCSPHHPHACRRSGVQGGEITFSRLNSQEVIEVGFKPRVHLALVFHVVERDRKSTFIKYPLHAEPFTWPISCDLPNPLLK